MNGSRVKTIHLERRPHKATLMIATLQKIAMMRIRPACPEDTEELYRLEQRAFSGDRFKRRQLRYLLTEAHALGLVIECVAPEAACGLLGYGILLFRSGSDRARLYSLCVDPAVKGQQLGARLLVQLIDQARSRGCRWLSLEVRADNQPALSLYERHGFRPTDSLSDYYEDGCTAWRMVRCLAQSDTPTPC